MLDAVGFAHEGKKRRDRYTYDELAPIRPRLTELAGKYMADGEQGAHAGRERRGRRSWSDLDLFDALSHSLDFARAGARRPAGGDSVKALFPERVAVGVLEVPERAGRPRRRSRRGTIPHAGMGADVPGHRRAAWTSGRGGAALARAHRRRPSRGFAARPGLRGPAGGHGARAAAAGRARGRPGALGLARSRDLRGGAGPAADARQLELVRSWTAMARAPVGSPEFLDALDQTHERTVGLARARGEYDKVPLEVFLVRLDPFYRASTSTCSRSCSSRSTWLWPAPLARCAWRGSLLLAGLALHVAGIVDPLRPARAVRRSRTLYETMLFISAFGVAAAAWSPSGSSAAASAFALAPVLGALGLFIANRYETIEGRGHRCRSSWPCSTRTSGSRPT